MCVSYSCKAREGVTIRALLLASMMSSGGQAARMAEGSFHGGCMALQAAAGMGERSVHALPQCSSCSRHMTE